MGTNKNWISQQILWVFKQTMVQITHISKNLKTGNEMLAICKWDGRYSKYNTIDSQKDQINKACAYGTKIHNFITSLYTVEEVANWAIVNKFHPSNKTIFWTM